ncbi:hypothetical protein [Klebsiella pneumoniae]|nr:hypothetical protein [Klebsiella pneumoniae]
MTDTQKPASRPPVPTNNPTSTLSDNVLNGLKKRQRKKAKEEPNG